MAGENRSPYSVHRAGQSVGERLLRSFNGKLRDDVLNGEIFYSLKEARMY